MSSPSIVDEPTSPYMAPPPSSPPPAELPPSIPPLPLLLLDHAQALDDKTKEEFLYWLRMAILYHGGFYLTNFGVPDQVIDEVAQATEGLFKLDQEEKQKCAVENSSGFVGWGGVIEGECRETWEFGPEVTVKKDQAKPYHRIRAALNQYPSDSGLPDFKSTIKAYNKFLTDLAFSYNQLIAEALGLSGSAFDSFFDEQSKTGGRIKFTRYFRGQDPKQFGEAPYVDAWLSFTLFVNDVPVIETQSEAQKTLRLIPLPSTLLVRTGTALSFATHQSVLSLPCRVLQPPMNAPDALTVRFTIELNPDVKFSDIWEGVDAAAMLDEARKVGADRRAKRKKGFEAVRRAVGGVRGFQGKSGDTVSNTARVAAPVSVTFETLGEADLHRRIRARPGAGKKHYPEVHVEISA